MLEIRKRGEPRKLLEYRQKDFASYADMPVDVKDKVLESLLSEQGHLCAYCMCSIKKPERTGAFDRKDKRRQATIEHCLPQAVTDENERLNYRNMLAVCWGNRDAHSDQEKSCDAKRGSLPQSEQTMKAINVFVGRTLSEIQYLADGTIYSDNPDVEEDLIVRLNLNCEARRLKDCRLRALHELHSQINKRFPDKTAPQKYFQELLDHYTSQSEKKTPYSGIIIAWLRTKV